MLPRPDSGNPEPGDLPPNRSDINPIAGRVEAYNPAPRSEPAVPPGLNAGPDILSLIKGLRRRWLLAATLGTLLACVAAAATYYLLSPKYTATAQIRVLFTEDTLGRREMNATAFTTFLKSQASLMTSRPIIEQALKDPDMKGLGLDAKYPDVVAHLSEELKVEMMESSEFLTLTYSCSDADQARVVVRVISEVYFSRAQRDNLDAKSERVRQVSKAFDASRTELMARLQRYNDQVKDSGDDPAALQRKAEALQIDLRELANQRYQLVVEKAKLEGLLQAAEDRLEAARLTIPSETDLDKALTGRSWFWAIRSVSPFVTDADVEKALEADLVGRRLLAELTVAEKVIRDYKSVGASLDGATPRHAQAVIDRVKPQLEARRGELRQKMSQQIILANEQAILVDQKVYGKQLKTLAERIKKVEEEHERVSGLSIKANQASPALERARLDVEQETRNLDNLRAQMEEAKLLQITPVPRVSIYQPAALMKRDTKKQMVGTAAVPAFVFLLVCLVLAYGDYRQRRVRSVRDMSTGLGIPVFGIVPEVSHPERHLIGPVTEPEIDAQPVLESIDALRTQLLHSSAQESCRIVLVTSAVAGEGKTTLASHLATSLARAGRKTLLVDGDLRRPALHQLFELPQQPGLSEVLLGEVETVDAVQATTLDGLSVITAGQWDRDVMQALARGSLGGIFEKLLQEFDFVVVDSHPVLAATDTLVIAQQAEGVILSVRRDLSQTPRVYAAQQKLAALGVRLLGAVVSGADPLEIYGSSSAQAPAAA